MSVTSAPSLEQDPAATDKVEARRHSLERYLQAILEAPDSRWRESGPWSVFLDIPAHASTSALSAGRGFDISHALNNVATASELLRPDRWLAECKLVSDECRNVREAIVRKDSLAAAGNASAMHTALIQIRARVASLTDRVGHLDQALRTINSRNRNAPFAAGYLHSASSTTGKAKDDIPLSADDVQRYEDLLVNLKAEKDRIVKLLSTSAQSASHSKSSFGDISVSEELLGSRSSASPRPSTNRRAFGVGRETDQTRALDNNGLLLLQQKTISEQDQMLESLSTVIRRQKELGTTVGVEIEEQTQMLGELGDGIDAVSGNLKHATKKLDRVRGGKR
ncbi:hypothetical protein HDU83_006120 [Entophlyctis luteolus]|nr:hypothetical protein HDU82_002492 [Entophlyctis luteolus]KAJ3353915.1 hypothetical protein HDU83_006120 [Entophlyctis luteolus]